MSYGLRIWRADGVLQFDSTLTERTGLALDPIQLAASAGTTNNYTALAGRTLEAIGLTSATSPSDGSSNANINVNYTNGYPQVVVTAKSYSQNIAILIL